MSIEVAHIGWLGYVVFAIVEVPVFFIILSTILGKPWKPKVTLTVIASLLTLAGGFVLTAAVGGAILSEFVP